VRTDFIRSYDKYAILQSNIYNMSTYVIKDKEGIYYLTSTVVAWVDVFTRQAYRDIIIESLNFCIEKKHLHLHAYVIMSNHFHWIISSDQGFSVDGLVRDIKQFTSKEITNAIANNEKESRREWMLNTFKFAGATHHDNDIYKFWQRGNHAEPLLTNDFIEQKINYIHMNPVRAGIVEKPEDYLYSSARNYLGIEGIIVVEPLIIYK
jgi:putative transposase